MATDPAYGPTSGTDPAEAESLRAAFETESNLISKSHQGAIQADHDVQQVSIDSPVGRWQPKWLRKRVFAAFGLWFILLAGAIEGLVILSNSNKGIASKPGEDNLYYLWTFGPSTGG